MGKECWLTCASILCTVGLALASFGYYKLITPYGTGDTILQTWDGHIGADYNHPHKKWEVECMDGEAVIGILDNGDDFTRLWYVWCKFMFPYKPPTQGVYPYYPSCHVRNFTTQYFCYHSLEHEKTVNTFVTAFYGHQWNFIVERLGQDDLQPYKCCKTPKGYYLDYTACYYQPTHDSYWEYYDSPAYFTVYCATGYVMTGLAKRTNPYTTPDAHIDWIQCCRVGFGVVPNQPAPTNNGSTATLNYNNIKAYNYQRTGPNSGAAGAYSRFANDPQTRQDEEAHTEAWPTSGDNWPMSGTLLVNGAAATTQSTNQEETTTNNSYYAASPEFSEFFSTSGGSSTLGPLINTDTAAAIDSL